MTTRPVGETSIQILRHEVRAVHATTGAPIAVRAAFAAPPPYGWALRAVPNGIVITQTAAGEPGGPATPVRLRLTATDPAARLAQPEAEITLAQPVITHPFAPLPSTLEIALVTATGPSTGKTVAARPSSGAEVPLPEEEPGIYRSAPVAWTAGFHPFEIRVGGLLLRRAHLDVSRPITRIRVVDTT